MKLMLQAYHAIKKLIWLCHLYELEGKEYIENMKTNAKYTQRHMVNTSTLMHIS